MNKEDIDLLINNMLKNIKELKVDLNRYYIYKDRTRIK